MLILEHRNAFQSSIPLSIYLSLVAIADVIKARSFLMRPGLQALGALCAATAVIKFILVVLQEVPKNVTPDANERYVQESTGGFWNRTLAIWVNPILIRGYSNALELSDLATLGPQFTSRSLSVRFASYWEVTNQKSNHALLFTSGWALRWPFLYPVIPRLCLTGFSFASPPLIRRILVYLNKVAEEDFDSRKQHSYAKTALIVSFVLVYTGIAVRESFLNGPLIGINLTRSRYRRHQTCILPTGIPLCYVDSSFRQFSRKTCDCLNMRHRNPLLLR